MKALLASFVLLLSLPLQAEIFKCTINGSVSFTDKPCGDNAETVTLEINQPDAEAVKNQQSITQRFEQDTRVNQKQSLRQKNEALTAKIDLLQQQRQRELDSLRQRTYTTEDGRMATREHGLFEKMDKVDSEYQQQIQQLRQQIRANERSITQP